MSKSSYKIQNWAEYDAALVKRGDITMWFAEDYVQKLVGKPLWKTRCAASLFKRSYSNVIDVESRI